MPILLIVILTLIFVPCHAVAAETSWQNSLAEGTNRLNNQAVSSAEKCFRQAVKEVELAPHTADDKVKCLNELANVLTLENKTDAAVAIYRESLDILKQTYGNSSKELLPALFALGSINESEGDHKAAMAYYKQAIAINERHYGPLSSTNDQAKKVNKQQQLPLSTLVRQPGLDASNSLKKLLPDYDKDLLKKDESSGQDLISSFQSEIAKDGDMVSGDIAVSPGTIKSDEVKRSYGM